MNRTKVTNDELQVEVTDKEEPTVEVVDNGEAQVIEVEINPDPAVIEVLIPGERGAKGDKGDKGASFNDTPFDFDPVEIYLNAKNGE